MKASPISILLLLVIPTMLFSQKNTGNVTNEARQELIIGWVAQYPAEDADSNRNFFQKFGDLVLGPKPEMTIKPVAVCTDDRDQVIMLCQGNGKIIKIAEKKSISLAGEILKNNHFYPSLVSLCSLPGKGILFTDSHLNEAILLSEDEKRISKFNKQTQLAQPTGIAYSKKTGQVWIIETGLHRISIFDSRGSYIKTIGKRGSEPGEFNYPTHIWIDNKGIVYVVDAMNFRIQIFDENGEFISSFGKQGDATGSLARPKGIATDSKGHIYIADALFNKVQVFNNKGELLYYFGEQGSGKGQFWMPAGLYIDQKDYIYVSDSFNNRVQVFKLLKEI